MTRLPIQSTNIKSAGYDADQQILEVEFVGSNIYQFYRVPQVLWDEFQKAQSKGSFFYNNVRGKFTESKIAIDSIITNPSEKKLYIVIPMLNCLDLSQATVESIMKSDMGRVFKIILIDNASDDGTKEWGESFLQKRMDLTVDYIRNEPSKSVAASWNQGIKRAFEDPDCAYVAVLNNDIVLHPKTLKHLMAFMDKTHYLMVTGDNVNSRMSMETLLKLELPQEYTDYDTWKIEGWRSEGPDFSCFMINRETIRVLGWFDENFLMAYCEDQDYHARCMMARRHATKHNDQGIDPEFIHFKRLSTAPYFHHASQTLKRNPLLAKQIMQQHGLNQQYYLRKFGNEHAVVMDGGGHDQPFAIAGKNWRDW